MMLVSRYSSKLELRQRFNKLKDVSSEVYTPLFERISSGTHIELEDDIYAEIEHHQNIRLEANPQLVV